MRNYIFFTIKNNDPKTKAQAEELVNLLNNGHEVIDTFSWKMDSYYILVKTSQETKDKVLN